MEKDWREGRGKARVGEGGPEEEGREGGGRRARGGEEQRRGGESRKGVRGGAGGRGGSKQGEGRTERWGGRRTDAKEEGVVDEPQDARVLRGVDRGSGARNRRQRGKRGGRVMRTGRQWGAEGESEARRERKGKQSK